MVRLKSREGDVFDVESWILQISPVLSDVESSDEVPLPLVGTRALKLLLAHCAEQRARTRWTLSRKLPTADLEELHGAAHVLALDHLGGLCATKLADCILQCEKFEGRPAPIGLATKFRVLRSHAARLVPQALAAVVRSVSSGGLDALEVVSRHSSHSSADVRLAVARAMSSAPPGHPVADWLPRRLRCEEVELVQIELLSSIAKALPPMNASLVVPFLAPNRTVDIRCAAVMALKALASAAGAPHAGVLAALVGAAPLYTRQGISDSSPKVRLLALEVFEQLNSKALRIIKAVGGRLQDEDDVVREAAVNTLLVLSAEGKEDEVSTAIHSALEALRHPASAIRSCAIRVLCQIGRGNSVAMSGLAAYLSVPGVQSTACFSLLKVAGAREAIKVALSCLESGSQKYRDAAPHCLQVMAGQVPGQWMVRCISALLPRYLSHKEPRTRLAALKVLGRWHKESAKGRTTSKEGQDQESKEGKGNSLSRAVVDRAVLRTVGLRLLDKHPVVRGEAYLFAGKLGLPCRMQLLAPLAYHMAHRRRQELVARAFDALAADTCRTISLLRPALKHKCPNACAAAIQVLAQLCVQKKMGCTPALQTILDTMRQNNSQEIAGTGQQAIVSILGAVADGQGGVSKELLEATSHIEGPSICIAVAKMCNDLSPMAFDDFLHRLLCMLQAPDKSRKHCAILALPFLFPTVRDGKHIAVEAVAELLCHSSWPVRWAAAAALIQLDPGKLPSFGSCQSSQNMRSHQPLSPVPPFRVAIQNAVKLQAQSDQRFVRDVAKHLSSMDLTGQKCQMLCSQALLVASKLQEKKRGRDSEQSRNARSSSQARHKRDKFQKLAPSSLVPDLTS